jgi:uncharacterized protein YneF (UPF0154 family)
MTITAKSKLGNAGKIEIALHAACVKAGAYAIAHSIIDRFPLARPFLAKTIQSNLNDNSPAKIQKQLIRDIYRRHGLKPAKWEVSAIIAVAETSSKQWLDTKALERRLRQTLGDTASKWLLKFAPLAQWAPDLLAAVAQTWAIGRYADSVCRIRKIGSDWLPAPLAKNLKLPANVLWNWTDEAFGLALPVLRTLQNSRFMRG